MSLPLAPYPTGWYAVGLSDELRPGQIRTFSFMGEPVVLFRSEAGVATLMGAFCPHLGAHLGHGGTVRGEHIRCPFHGFEFDRTGACKLVPYGPRVPAKARARVTPLREQHGLLLAYFDPTGAPPTWEIPTLDLEGWSPLLSRTWELRGHPQETTENSVDMGHFSAIHGYTDVASLRDLVTEGPYLSARYKMTRERAIFGRSVESEFQIHVHGLGYSQVDIHVRTVDLRLRLFVLATPTEGETIRFRVAMNAHRATFAASAIHPLLGLVPRALVFDAALRGAFRGVCNDVAQDFEIWRNKRYVPLPMLAEGDGPIGKYRRWARQFYPVTEQATVRAAG